jgi:L-ascorbate metabolism protein UlaG (beta-lactamase superfamily)
MMKLTFHGHSCVQVETGKHNLIIDPFLTGNPAAKVKASDIKPDYVLLTHGHNDHMGDAIELAKGNDALLIAPNELAVYAGWQGCRVHPMGIGGARSFEFGRVKLTQAFHSSGYELHDTQQIVYMGMPAGLLLTIDGLTIYHAGDTSLFGDMKLIGERNAIDLAFLPIGDNFTMGPEDALVAAKWIRAKRVVPVHYDTFPLIAQDGHAFARGLAEEGIEGIVLEPGESLEL